MLSNANFKFSIENWTKAERIFPMNITNLMYESKDGQRRIKPQIIMVGGVLAFAGFVLFFLLIQRQTAPNNKMSGPFITPQAMPQRNLDYQIIKVDTLPFSYSTAPSATSSPSTSVLSPASPSVTSQPERSTRSAVRAPASPPRTSAVSPRTSTYSQSDNMIVVSSLEPGQRATIVDGSGSQMVRLKVFVPQKTPVMNGSVVEVRVMKDDRYGSLEIPRRSQLVGFCSLQNNRVQIDFRELKVGGTSYRCRGSAYDLKQLPGLPYFPLDNEAKKAVWDEVKSTAAGIPVVGRYLNQPNVDPFTQEVTTLDEGLEFYALVEHIF
jgi:hypothetical protein